MARYEAWLEHARAHQLDSRLVTAAEVAALLARGVAALGRADCTRRPTCEPSPGPRCRLLAGAAAADGLTIVEGCAARGLVRMAGRVTGVATEAGEIRAPEVVVAAGAWSRLFLGAEGVAMPQLSVRATVAATGPLPEVAAVSASDDRIAFRRRADGGYTLATGGFHELFIGRDAVASLRAWLPQLRDGPVRHPVPAGGAAGLSRRLGHDPGGGPGLRRSRRCGCWTRARTAAS